MTERTPRLGLLDYLMLPAADVPALVAFYCEVLGATVIEEAYPFWARIRVANIDVGLHQAAGGGGTGAKPGFRVQDVAALRTHLEAHGVTVEGGYHAIPGGVRLTFTDAAGNHLDALQYGIDVASLS